jgi:hypothetical protein
MRLLCCRFVGGLGLLVALAIPVQGPAHAAHPGWSAYAGQPKRVYFRPVATRASDSAISRSRWRPSPLFAGSQPDRRPSLGGNKHSMERYRQSAASTPRLPERRFATVNRSAAFGGSFRPDGRNVDRPPTAQGVGSDVHLTQNHGSQLQNRFRPAQRSRRATYEELQVRSAYARYPAQPSFARSRSPAGTFDGSRVPSWRSW